MIKYDLYLNFRILSDAFYGVGIPNMSLMQKAYPVYYHEDKCFLMR